MLVSHPLEPHWPKQVTRWSLKSQQGGSAEDTDPRRGEELGPCLSSIAQGVWGIGELGCSCRWGSRGRLSCLGDKFVENDWRGRREVARRLLQPREGTQAPTTARAVGMEEIDYATFVP